MCQFKCANSMITMTTLKLLKYLISLNIIIILIIYQTKPYRNLGNKYCASK